jgi:DNA helicase HerA-like ATPase
MAFEIALWSEGSYEIAVVCEEAHRYVPTDQSQAFGPTRQAIGRIAKEGRKYGVSLGIVTQRPAELDATVLSQCSTLFAMRLANEQDKAIIRSALGASSASTIAFLSSIADREAIAFGEAIATPMRMKFGDYRLEPPYRASADPEPNMARLDLRKIVAQLRGEYVGDPA